MTDWTAGPVEAAKKGWIDGVVGSIRNIGAGRPTRVQNLPETLKGDVGLPQEDKSRGWWEYR
ncbi:hypothetical protein [Pelagibacterium sp. H642]|uniref:hypothetical protein n=1 Tax=Pelagibacterium sp. H642 TaxID=1881069 RepID=UPI00281669D3|nr:hypothetical protein [Pelagibacterium sp. H642]WMT90043.1 hypothetical protein NO934_14765 [Pelagibacterium sp. H642]